MFDYISSGNNHLHWFRTENNLLQTSSQGLYYLLCKSCPSPGIWWMILCWNPFPCLLEIHIFEHIIASFQAISTWHSVKSEYIFPTAIWLWYEEITVKVNYPIQNQFSPEGFPKCFWSTREINLPDKLCEMHVDVLV